MLFFIDYILHVSHLLRYLNTSHVILYQSLIRCMTLIIKHLNTSHVILYQDLFHLTGGGNEI